MFKKLLFLFSASISVLSADLYAQGNVKFSGVAQSDINFSDFGGNLESYDQINPSHSLDGRTYLDLGITYTPNAVTEIKGVTRLSNSFGGFFGAGLDTRLRELYVKSIVGGKFRFQVGDFNESLTPYTFWNNEGDLSINTPTLFKEYEDVIAYENYYNGNTWRQQGLKFDFALDFEEFIESVEVKAFISKSRDANLRSDLPTTLFGGANVTLNHKYVSLGLNWVNLFDIEKTTVGAASEELLRNPVLSVNLISDLDLSESFALLVNGEAGYSKREVGSEFDSLSIDGSFFDFGVTGHIKSAGVKIGAGFFSVDSDFRSPGAQTRRNTFNEVDYVTNLVGNDEFAYQSYLTEEGTYFSNMKDSFANEFNRNLSLLDFSKDHALYNNSLSRGINSGSFDPHYNNANPYGKATPNRSGFNFDVELDKEGLPISAVVNTIVSTELKSTSSPEKRSFFKTSGGVTVDINEFIGTEKDLKVLFGAMYQTTQRDAFGGSPQDGGFVEVDLSTTYFEGGVDYELFKNLYVTAAARYLTSEGSEYLTKYDQTHPGLTNYANIVSNDADLLVYDSEEYVYGGGIKYQFTSNIYAKADYLKSESLNNVLGREDNYDYTFDQFSLLFNMRF